MQASMVYINIFIYYFGHQFRGEQDCNGQAVFDLRLAATYRPLAPMVAG
jgi:hypothetical protein